jgi:integrase
VQIRGLGHVFRPKYKTLSGEVREQAVYWWKAPTGQRYSTGQRSYDDAQRWALDRASEMRHGQAPSVGAPARYDDLERMLLDDWEAKGRRGIPQAVARLKHLRRAFSGWQAAAITSDKVTGYAVRRKAEGAAPATINVEIAVLHRAFVLAKRAGRLRDVPIMDRLGGVRHRTGTVERGDFEAILDQMRARYHGALRFLYWTGWRRGEALSLTWQHVDLAAQEVRLAAENSKTSKPRIICYTALPELVDLMTAQYEARRFSPYVFPGKAGKPLDRTALGKAWRDACIKVGVPNALIHDLRRTMTRDLRRANVSLAVAMGTVGHDSLEVHHGYSPVSRDDQTDGLARLEALRSGEPIQRRFAQFTPKGE